MIKDLIDKGGEVNLFTRPRRFGKSLGISMLQYFFDNLKKDDSDIFDGLHISRAGEQYLAHQNKYPVIKLTLKEASSDNFDDSFKKLINEISSEFKRHKYVLTNGTLESSEKDKYQRIIDETAVDTDYSLSLKFLSECLEKYYNEKVIILIDEYDVPLEKSYFSGYYDKMVNFIRAFFGGALKTNDSLKFAVITGCLRVSKESIFTGINNLNIVSILSDSFGEYFGFTEPEIDGMLKHYDLEHKTDEMQDWYNGYLFGETVVYNPWSSIKYLLTLFMGKWNFQSLIGQIQAQIASFAN